MPQQAIPPRSGFVQPLGEPDGWLPPTLSATTGDTHGFPLHYCGGPTKIGKNAGADAGEQDETEWQDHHLAALDFIA